ncbi:MAG: hypothetical protein V4850_32180 [Myxococcota bacterium]
MRRPLLLLPPFALLLAWAAATARPRPVDDVYIALVYVYELLEHGRLAWSTGEAVEGASSPLFLALLLPGVAVGLDGAWVAQAVSFAAGLATIALLLRRGAVALALGLVAWAPFGWWCGQGMDGVVAGLVWGVAWSRLTTSGFGAAAGWFVLGCLARPEGHLHLAAAGLYAVATAGTRGTLADRRVVLAAAALGAWHLGRVAWFGAVIPAPVLVKTASRAPFADGLGQLGVEAVGSVGLLALVALAVRLAPRAALLASAPFVIQAVVLLEARGDWMGWGRLLLPGGIAAVLVAAAAGEPRSWTPQRAALGAVAIAALAYVGLPAGAAAFAPRAWPTAAEARRAWASGFETPLPADVAWLVAHLPDGAAILTGDVGLPGHVPGVRVLDDNGLVFRRMAEARAAGGDAVARLQQALLVGPGREADCMRLVDWHTRQAYTMDPVTEAANPWSIVYDDGPARIRVLCAADRTAPIDPAVSLARWEALVARFPEHPWLRWQLGRALADLDRADEAVAVLLADDRLARAEAIDRVGFTRGPTSYGTRRGHAFYWNGTLTSRPLTTTDVVRLELSPEHPGAEGVSVRFVGTGGCTWEESRTLHDRATIDVPVCTAPGRVSVSFLNDATGPAGDRNLYVHWRE